MKTIADLPGSRFDEAVVALTDYEANKKAREAERANESSR